MQGTAAFGETTPATMAVGRASGYSGWGCNCRLRALAGKKGALFLGQTSAKFTLREDIYRGFNQKFENVHQTDTFRLSPAREK